MKTRAFYLLLTCKPLCRVPQMLPLMYRSELLYNIVAIYQYICKYIDLYNFFFQINFYFKYLKHFSYKIYLRISIWCLMQEIICSLRSTPFFLLWGFFFGSNISVTAIISILISAQIWSANVTKMVKNVHEQASSAVAIIAWYTCVPIYL